MQPKFSLVLILLLPIVGFSQASQSIDFVGGMEYSYRTLTTTSKDRNVLGNLEIRDSIERGKLNWRIGFNYNQKIGKKIFIKTGIRLASVGYQKEKRTGLRWPSEHDGMGGWSPDPNLPHEIQTVLDYWFAEMPLAARFEMNKKKLSPFFELGISPSIFLATRVKSITDIGKDASFHKGGVYHFKKFHMVGVISLGLNYSVNEKFQIFGQPAFRYHFTKLVDAPIDEYLFNYGIEIGIRRSIK
jgi:hypothetical protein